jgi:hypothetical protein
MGVRKASPGEGGGKAYVHFPYVSTSAGAKWFAYVAGPCHWIIGHDKGRTKVCTTWATDGQVKCKLCSPLNPKKELGYQPLYRATDTKPVMVLVHEEVRETIDKLQFHDRVIVGRELDATAGVFVVRALQAEPKFHSTLHAKNTPAALDMVLVRIWNMPEYTSWFMRHEGCSDNEVSLPDGTAVTDEGKPYSPLMQGPAKRWGASVVEPEGPMDESVDQVREELKRRVSASKNGKHKPPPKG